MLRLQTSVVRAAAYVTMPPLRLQGDGMFDDAYESSVNELGGVPSEAALFEFLKRLIERYGLQHAVYHAISLPAVQQTNPVTILTYPAQWVERYVEQNYFSVDPVIGAAATSLLPVDWAELDRRGPGAKQVFDEAAEFGIGPHGLSFPIRGVSGERALFTITSGVADAEWAKLKRAYLRDFHFLSHLVHERVLGFVRSESTILRSLSSRERQCLCWAAMGKTNKEIARELDISERVVRAYFESARFKLNCTNRAHLISRAFNLRLIDPEIASGRTAVYAEAV
ncbi:MAG: LuxR family transcriptional regulator [Blastochloris sp.]|nr:LuxR family transcriptional regulator [Blastochloris sp.]